MRGKFQMDAGSFKVESGEINAQQGAISGPNHVQAASDFGGRTVTVCEDQIKAQPQGAYDQMHFPCQESLRGRRRTMAFPGFHENKCGAASHVYSQRGTGGRRDDITRSLAMRVAEPVP
jgi:hypothetical protein